MRKFLAEATSRIHESKVFGSTDIFLESKNQKIFEVNRDKLDFKNNGLFYSNIIVTPIVSNQFCISPKNFTNKSNINTFDRVSINYKPSQDITFLIPPKSHSELIDFRFSSGASINMFDFSNIYDTFVIDIIFFLEIEIEELDIRAFPFAKVSNNLFMEIQYSSVAGKKYLKDEFRNAFTKDVTDSKIKKNNITPTYEVKISSNNKDKDRQHYIPSFFDLIKPLLYPPPYLFEESYEGFVPIGKKPYDFQIEGINKLVNNKSFLLADEMGTGKTVMATLAARILFRKGEIRKALILSPVSVLRVWEYHINDWSLGELSIALVRGHSWERKQIWNMPFHVYITSYDTYRIDFFKSSNKISNWDFDLVILDEAQLIKNRNSKRHKAVKQSNFKYKWLLTGTPLENKVDDVKALFEFLMPNLIHKNIDNPIVIRDLIRPYMLRRLKKDVLRDLPEKTRQIIWLELTEKQKEQYDNVMAFGIAKLSDLERENRVTRQHIFALLSTLKQICNFPVDSIISSKANALIDMVEDIVASEDKAVIFSQFIGEGITKIEKVLNDYQYVKIVGGMDDAARNSSILLFQNDPSINLFLASTKASGTGITLTEASYVFLFDHWWNPAIMRQAEDRVHRPGQKKPVIIYEYWIENTVEERIYKLLEQKKALAGQVIDSLATEFDDEIISIDEWLHKIFQISPDDHEPIRKEYRDRFTDNRANVW